MAGWGVGIGSFATGLSGGFKLGESIQAGQQTRKLNDMRIESGQMELDQKRKDVAKTQQFESLGITGKKEFDAAVKAGTADPAKPEDFWTEKMAPRYQQYYLENGDPVKAEAFRVWAKDTKTKKTVENMGMLLGQFNVAAETGNFDGLSDGLGKFYNGLDKNLRDGSVFSGLDVSKDPATGAVTGVNVVFLDKNDQPVQHTFKDIGSFQQAMQGWANPSALFEQTLKSREAAAKLKGELAEHGGKKKIEAGLEVEKKIAEKNLGLSGKSPADRYNEAEKMLSEHDTGWLKKKPEERDALVRERLARADAYERSVAPGIAGGGQAAPPPVAQKVIIDTKTGKPVVVPTEAQPPGASPAEPAASPAGAPAPAAATLASITAPRPGSKAVPAPSPQGFGIPGIGAVNEGVQSGYDPVPAQPAASQPQAQAPTAQAGAKRRVQMPQSGPTPLPNGGYSDEGTNPAAEAVVGAAGDAARATGEAVVSAGKSVGKTVAQMPEVRAVAETGKAILNAMPQIGTDSASRMNAARQSAGLPARKGKGPVFQASEHIEGLDKPGNIDLGNRPEVRNTDGTVSTVRSISIGVGDKTVLIPTVVKGKVVSDEEAIRHFKSSGEHLGVFKDQPSADAYAGILHEQQTAQSKPKGRQRSQSAPGLGLGG